MALEDASTTKKGVVQLSSATNSTSESQAATPKAVKAAYDLANGKYTAQDATTAQKGIVQLSSATNSASETLAATPKAVKAANDNANGRVPSARKVNGKALSADITLTPKDIGTLNSTTMSFSGGAGWFKLATVTMPQASSIVYIALIGGAGYNVGSPHQAGISELVLRAGNGNPKGITGALWKRTAVGLTNFAWINTSGDTYDIYVEIGNYATSVNIHWDCTANASVSVYTSPTYSASKPSSVTYGVVYTMYSTHQKPTPLDIGALPTTGGTVSGPLSVTGGLTGSLNGNASTATKLQTARSIGGVVFDGSANINLPGVNTTGNQNTTGNAATATKLQTARNINGVPFDGTKDITLTPKDLDAYSKSEVQSALAGKQPLDNTLTNLSGKDVAGLLAYLGLGETINKASGAMQKSANGADISDVSAFRNALQLGTAATRDVGADNASKLLGLDSFRSMMSGNGYIYIPCIATTGNPVKLMLQWGMVATQKGADAGYALPFAFPYAGLFATGNRGTSGYNAAMNVRIASRNAYQYSELVAIRRGHRRLLFYRAGVLRMNKFYKGSFYPKALKEVYISAGSWPENGVDVDDETMAIYTGVAPQGKTLGADKNGNPAWIDIPPLSAEQQIIQAEQKRTVLRSMADKEIAWRQDAFDAEIATAEETAALSEWKKYRVLLMRVDTAKPVWPVNPQDI